MNEIALCLKEQANSDGHLSYYDFVNIVLYTPHYGYYTKKKARVGRSQETDFYTAASLGEVFRDLILESIKNILGKQPLENYTFVELGPEDGMGLLGSDPHPFAKRITIAPNEEHDIPPQSIVFSNEVLDAQAFVRFVFHNKVWRELGVSIKPSSSDPWNLQEVLLDDFSKHANKIVHLLPKDSSEGYQLDFPLGAEELLQKILAQNWQGLLLFFDYGYPWDILAHHRPQGSARAYHKHRQHNNLLEHLADQDITCHPCWDRLINLLQSHHFTTPSLLRQESFFMKHAQTAIEKILSKKPEDFDQKRLTIQELLLPCHMGSRFEVLHAIRE